MVILTGVRITTIERREKEKRGILDTGSRWTWISKGVADEMGIELTKKMKARTADNRLAEGVLSAKPVNFKLIDYEVNLWLTPCVAEWLAEDIIIGNDFMDKAVIRLTRGEIEFYEPVGELYFFSIGERNEDCA